VGEDSNDFGIMLQRLTDNFNDKYHLDEVNGFNCVNLSFNLHYRRFEIKLGITLQYFSHTFSIMVFISERFLMIEIIARYQLN
jgi:hypothetical protein